MHTDSKQEESPEDRHKRFRRKAFRIALELIVIFGAPALAAFFGGQYLDGVYQTGQSITFGLLGLAFVFSWAITIWRVRKLSKQFDKTEQEMKTEDASGDTLQQSRLDEKE